MAIPRWEILLGQLLGILVGLALIAAGLALWVKNPGPTVSTVTVVTVSGPHHTHDKTITTVLDGPQSALAVAKSPDAVPQRSAPVTIGLVASGVLLLLGTSWLPRLRSLTVPASPDEPEEDEDEDDDE
jgi:hypothetical protein